MLATVFRVDVKTSLFAAPGIRPVLFAISVLMALLAYMPAPACAIPGGTGEATDAAIFASPPAHAYEIRPGPAP